MVVFFKDIRQKFEFLGQFRPQNTYLANVYPMNKSLISTFNIMFANIFKKYEY